MPCLQFNVAQQNLKLVRDFQAFTVWWWFLCMQPLVVVSPHSNHMQQRGTRACSSTNTRRCSEPLAQDLTTKCHSRPALSTAGSV